MFVERLVELDFGSLVRALQHIDFIFVADNIQCALHHLLVERFPFASGILLHELAGCGLGKVRHKNPVTEKAACDFAEFQNGLNSTKSIISFNSFFQFSLTENRIYGNVGLYD